MNILETNKFHIAVFDVGDKHIKCSVLHRSSFRSDIEIIANHTGDADGFSNGYIVDLDLAEQSIKAVLYKVEEMCNIVIDDCIVIVSSYLLESKYLDINMKLNGNKILQTDIDDILRKSWNTMKSYDADMECLHCFPLNYTLDNAYAKIQNPVGLVCDNLQVLIHAFFVPQTITENLRTVFNKCDLNIVDFVAETWAYSLGNISDVSLKMGVISLELNYYRTNLSIIKDNNILYTTTIDHSMYDIIQDISMYLIIDVDEGEMVMSTIHDFMPHESNKYKHIEIKRSGKDVISVRQDNVLRIIYNHLDTIIAKVKNILEKEINIDVDTKSMHVFISGFGLENNNLPKYMEYNMHNKVISVNDYILTDEMKKLRKYSSSLGVLRYLNNYDMIMYKIRYQAHKKSFMQTIRNWYAEISDL